MTIENTLIDAVQIYGPLGLWVAYMIWERYKFNGQLMNIIDSHTESIDELRMILTKLNGRLK